MNGPNAFAEAWAEHTGQELGEPSGYDPAGDIDVNPDDFVSESEAREMQQRVDDDLGERWGYEPGVRRYVA